MIPSLFPHNKLWAASLAAAFVAAGCGGSGSDTSPKTGDVTILHSTSPGSSSAQSGQQLAAAIPAATPSAQSPAAFPSGVDSMQIEFKDANGQLLYGPIEVPATPQVTIPDVPLNASSITVDYLRNGGFALASDDEAITWNNAAGSASPVPAAVEPSTTQWHSSIDAHGNATLTVAVEGGPAQSFLIKGVGYSPAPIGFSNKYGPGFGDIFWDTPGGFLDFEKVWKRDVETIRGHGFNAVRTYSLIANFIKDDGSIPTQAEINSPGSLLVREHKKFLDEMWNNGVNPIYVIVGIPMPPAIFEKDTYDDARAIEIEYWDNNFTATITQMQDHPAVLGFTLFNEVIGSADTYANLARARHFWEQVQKYSERAKQIAPSKLVGWAYFDDPMFAANTLDYRRQYAKAIDFYGINAFQTQQLATTLDPWKQSAQSDTARPVILTEYGMPTTVRNGDGNPPPIHSTEASINETAKVVGQVIPQAFKHPVVAGMFYFEWSDEWWKQDGGSDIKQEGGNSNPGFPNKYWDEEGFGLYSISLGDRSGEEVYADADWKKGSNVQVDQLTPKTELLNVLIDIYKNAGKIREEALAKP